MSKDILAPMPGTIVEILVSEGETVEEMQELIVLEAMKMENAISATAAGTVKSVSVAVGDKVAVEQVLVVIE
ncbi:MAG: acetyl-CoA carboxylase biotin carboxyl carrier protein subunit [Desulfobacterales bacterium]|nr:acetyl-CoA carboxylase biotin carboxyl carrier protein subunit [Desulfobacterales bacterium]